jgi:glyoxylase-like metal-dependent hydrolase (beta-lactamase superfamily II)/rhodanese-related sulfurtransferase
MILKQYYLGCLAHASYLIGDEQSRAAVVVDPQRDIDQYLEDARHWDLQIRHVFLTHFHADFVAGHLELRDRTGASIHLGSRAQAEYAFVPMKDGEALELGALRLQVLETPGHSPESICILVYDLARDKQKPHAVLTGDTLFIGDVGRPDLRASLGWTAEQLGRLLYDSLRDKLLPLPDETLVYPTHGAGSLCGKNLSEETFSTLGVQRRYNYALQPMSQEKFVEIVTAEQPEAPDYFTYDAVLNARERPTLDKALERELNPLALDQVLRLQQQGAQLLDVRDGDAFEGAHLASSLNIALDGRYATWCGTLLASDTTIALIASPGTEKEAAMRLGRIGFDRVAGYLEGGMQALDQRPELVRRTQRITAAALDEQLRSEAPPWVLDVRAEREWKEKRLSHSCNIPLNRLRARLDEVPTDRAVVVHCAGGYRSSIAASLLEQHHFAKVADLVGGIGAWEAAGLETVTGERM